MNSHLHSSEITFAEMDIFWVWLLLFCCQAGPSFSLYWANPCAAFHAACERSGGFRCWHVIAGRRWI